jgi:hypothetical protein
MMDESVELRNRIIGLSDEELTAMVTADRYQYRDEALAYAEAELERRGLPSHKSKEPPATEAPSFFSTDAQEKESGGESEGGSDAVRSVAFEVFRSSFASWEELFRQAAEFASSLGPDRVINISHSADRGEGVVTVWYLV